MTEAGANVMVGQEAREKAMASIAEALETCARASTLLEVGEVRQSLDLYARAHRQAVSAQAVCSEVAIDAAKIRIGCERTVATIQHRHPVDFQAWTEDTQRRAVAWLEARREECVAFGSACDGRPLGRLARGETNEADLVTELAALRARCLQADDFLAFSDLGAFQELSERLGAAGLALQRRAERHRLRARRRRRLRNVVMAVALVLGPFGALEWWLRREVARPATTTPGVATRSCELRAGPGEVWAFAGTLEAGEKVLIGEVAAKRGWQVLIADDGHTYWVREGCLAAAAGR